MVTCQHFSFHKVFAELMEIVTLGVEFSFNKYKYKQIDGVAARSLLGPALANIFTGFNETKQFSNTNKPHMYHCYVDITFVAFNSKKECDDFLFFSTPFIHLYD